jgi:hypothetical protein
MKNRQAPMGSSFDRPVFDRDVMDVILTGKRTQELMLMRKRRKILRLYVEKGVRDLAVFR